MPNWDLVTFASPKAKDGQRRTREEAGRPVRMGEGETWLVGVEAVAMEIFWRSG